MAQDKTYFLSDLHLGAPYIKDQKAHERIVVNFLNSIKEEAKAIYFVGDIFDFWYEWKNVIPKGFVRFQGKITELVDKGIDVHFFVGNHDLWMKDYLANELGVSIHYSPTLLTLDSQKCLVAHGEDIGIDDRLFKLLLRIFRAKWSQWLFSTLIPPSTAIHLAKKWSGNSRKKHNETHTTFLGEDKEHLVKYAKQYNSDEEVNFFIFGHRHIALDLMIKKNTRVVILGDWINHNSYAVLEKGQLFLTSYEE